jgi:hypothetical protein
MWQAMHWSEAAPNPRLWVIDLALSHLFEMESKCQGL